MSRFYRSVLTGAILALSAGPTVAGPIDWSYTITGGTPGGAPYLYLGTLSHTYGPNGEFTDTYRAYNPATPINLTGTHTGNLGSPVQVGDVSYPTLDLVSVTPRASESTWRVSFEITDLASGQSGSTFFDWTPLAFEGVFTSGTGVVDWAQETQMNTLVLGANRYTVTTFQQDQESHTPLFADVQVTANTPEPATAVLAGLGLTGVGFGRIRRQFS